MIKSSIPPATPEPLPLTELIAKLLLFKPNQTKLFPWLLPGSGTLQSLNQRLENQPLFNFLNYNLRGIGQVIFVNNPLSGLLILLALFIQSPWMGVMSVVGLVASTLTAILLNLNRESLGNGIFGYNGILVGAALATFGASGNGNWNPFWILATIIFSALTTLLINSVGVWFASKLKFPPLTLPFIAATLLFLAIAVWVPQPLYSLGNTPNPSPALEPINWLRVAISLPIGFGQVFLMDKFVAGVLVLTAVAWCTPIGAAVGLLGGVLGTLAALLTGVSPEAIYAGLCSYNAVLTAIAISGVFFAPNLRSLLVGIFLAFFSTLVGGVLSNLFTLLKLPILTLPFCLVTIAGFLFVRHTLPSLVPVALHAIASPEEHRQRYLVARDIITTFRRQMQAAMAGTPNLYLFDSASTSTKGDLEYLFNAIDTDFSNTLSVKELSEHLRQVKRSISPEELDYLFSCLDIDRSGEVDLAEFSELLLRQQRLMSNYQEFITYFLPIDTNQDDTISIDEMNLALGSVGELPLNVKEVNFLHRRMDGRSMTWNRFIEVLLVT